MNTRRARVLTALRAADGPLTIAEVAERLGMPVNTARFHLLALAESGQAGRVDAPASRPGRPPQLFVATAGMDPGGPRHYRLLAEALADSMAGAPDPSGQARAAGRTIGVRLGQRRMPAGSARPVDELVALMDEFGFSPSARERRIELRHCPFLELTSEHRDVVCPLHHGLMQGALDAWGAPVTVETLTPFVRPDLCLAKLSTPKMGASS
ncbi:helix-turn-helix transcriptional regulator [Mycolicibacterium brumae]|uniref:Transcriptional regulator n=1 Tax=Mycolicibacterium brumae TaxID=85968 RepID=A0A2G5PEJ6_9MYCO|nr:helix-turn-helix domain-containing protein [Mycolicibacterium brumae]MCV7192076.1 helix-turn-helix domain-containing protein [Mycolicibacterium brumae]PIB76726.1 transcriptional regulator [Mycolicibacterium brumae]RWA20741.1 hypothetical protein MBRU_03520 [Mycolicibacterium brumae DSM 44177]UWW07840.1 helix-turn-helix domain-containing protein [Mycolicibacterium brumae]